MLPSRQPQVCTLHGWSRSEYVASNVASNVAAHPPALRPCLPPRQLACDHLNPFLLALRRRRARLDTYAKISTVISVADGSGPAALLFVQALAGIGMHILATALGDTGAFRRW